MLLPLEALQVWPPCHMCVSRWQGGERLGLPRLNVLTYDIGVTSSLTVPGKGEPKVMISMVPGVWTGSQPETITSLVLHRPGAVARRQTMPKMTPAQCHNAQMGITLLGALLDRPQTLRDTRRSMSVVEK